MDHGELPPKKKKKTKRKAVAFEEPAAPAPAPAEPEEEEEIGWGAFCDALELDRRLARAVAQLGWTRPSLVQKATLPVALSLYSTGQNATDYGLLLAGSVLIIAPILLLFVFLQRYFIQGVATTGLK